jgi:mono/diheme cytochrome c family protein
VSGLRVPPLAAGLVAAALAFAAVALVTDGDGTRAAGSGQVERPPAAPSTGRAVFARMGCGSCHHLSAARSSGQIGPDLDLKLPAHTRASLRAKILAPGTASVMPSDFGPRMSDADLDALVNFLLAATPSR